MIIFLRTNVYYLTQNFLNSHCEIFYFHENIGMYK